MLNPSPRPPPGLESGDNDSQSQSKNDGFPFENFLGENPGATEHTGITTYADLLPPGGTKKRQKTSCRGLLCRV